MCLSLYKNEIMGVLFQNADTDFIQQIKDKAWIISFKFKAWQTDNVQF